MKNSLPDGNGQSIVVITLSMEAAYIAGNWVEFNQLSHRRSMELERLSGSISTDVLERIREIDRRMIEGMAKQKKAIAERAGRAAQFKRSLKTVG